MRRAPAEVTLDIDDTCDVVHGHVVEANTVRGLYSRNGVGNACLKNGGF
jgi:hypothetical protein